MGSRRATCVGHGSMHPMMKSDKQYLVAYGVCAIASLLPIWASKYVPMVDLPQHAAQLSIIMNLHDPTFGFEHTFTVEYFSPYVVTMAVSLFFAQFFGVLTALKLTLSIAILLWPFSLRVFLRKTHGDEWLSLLGFLFAYGHAFYWGLLPFEFAVPLGLLLLSLAVSYGERQANGKAAMLAAACTLLFFCHPSVFLYVTVISVVFLWFRGRTWPERIRSLLPFLVPLPAVVAWLVTLQGHGGSMIVWPSAQQVLRRLLIFPGLLFDVQPSGLLIVGSILSFGFLLFRDYKFRYSRALTVTTVFSVLVYLLVPVFVLRDGFLSERMTPFLAALLLASCSPRDESYLIRVKRVLTVLVIVVWMGSLTVRFALFSRDAGDIDSIVDAMRPRARALGLIFDPSHQVTPVLPFLHFVNWYQVAKGGVAKHSFAAYSFAHLARFKSPEEIEQYQHYDTLSRKPQLFDWEQESSFDYFVVRSRVDRKAMLFPETAGILLVKQRGNWWLYANPRGQPRREGH